MPGQAGFGPIRHGRGAGRRPRRLPQGRAGRHGRPGDVPRGTQGPASFDAADADFYVELLPGPRDARGLPEGLAFWLNRLEETDSERTFPVGLLYRAQRLRQVVLDPRRTAARLGDHIRAVYVEATAEDTESRLLRGLRGPVPRSTQRTGLVEVADPPATARYAARSS